jgi:hypothetical protein
MLLPRARSCATAILSLVLLATAAEPLAAQADILLRLRSGSPASDRVRVDSGGGLVALGAVGHGILPASGEGLRLMWHPYKGAFRAGAASASGEFNESNIGFYSWAGGNRTIANDFASFAFGDQVTVTGTSAAGFGGNNTIDGNFGFGAGSQVRCFGFVCHAVGFLANADGQGAIALGYRTTANADYSVAIGRMASTNGHTGAMVFGDASINDSVRASANNQFTVRAAGGIRLYSNATLTNGCFIAASGGSMSCTSSRHVKHGFTDVDGESVLRKIAGMPVQRWRYNGERADVWHLGPMAQDFRAAFGLGTDDTSIGVLDIAGVNLLAVQTLERRTRELDERTREVTALRDEVATLRARQEEMERRLARLEAALQR